MAQIEKWDVRSRGLTAEQEDGARTILNASERSSSTKLNPQGLEDEPMLSVYIANKKASVCGIHRNGSIYASLRDGSTFKPDKIDSTDDQEEIEYNELEIKSEIISHCQA